MSRKWKTKNHKTSETKLNKWTHNRQQQNPQCNKMIFKSEEKQQQQQLI